MPRVAPGSARRPRRVLVRFCCIYPDRIHRVGNVRVDTEALAALSATAESLSDEMRQFRISPPVAEAWQPTTTAVGTVDSLIQLLMANLVSHMRFNSDRYSRSAIHYREQDDESASAVGSIQV